MVERPAPHSRRSRARVAVSLTASRLSDAAGALVPTRSDGAMRPGAFVEAAVRLVEQNREALELAVILERERGATWEVIGESLRVPAALAGESARGRFGPAERRWRRALLAAGSPEAAPVPGLPAGAEAPGEWARHLDEWVLRRRGGPGPGGDARPVSGHLPGAGLAEEITAALADLRALSDSELHAAGASPEQVREWRARKEELFVRVAVAFERLAAAEPDSPAFADAAAGARRRLDELRAGDAGPD